MNHPVFIDLTYGAKTTIDRPNEFVWPCMLNQAAWMKDFTIEHIAGEPDYEGEIKRVTPMIRDLGTLPVKKVQPFFFKTLKLKPYQQFVYKAYTAQRGGEYGFTGIEILCLRDSHSSSVITFEAYLEFQSETMTEHELNAFVDQVRDGGVQLWDRNFARLCALIKDADR